MKPNTQSTAYPAGYTKPAEDPKREAIRFNNWQRHMQRELDKIFKTDKASKYLTR